MEPLLDIANALHKIQEERPGSFIVLNFRTLQSQRIEALQDELKLVSSKRQRLMFLGDPTEIEKLDRVNKDIDMKLHFYGRYRSDHMASFFDIEKLNYSQPMQFAIMRPQVKAQNRCYLEQTFIPRSTRSTRIQGIFSVPKRLGSQVVPLAPLNHASCGSWIRKFDFRMTNANLTSSVSGWAPLVVFVGASMTPVS